MPNKIILLVILVSAGIIFLAIPKNGSNKKSNGVIFTDIRNGSYEIDGNMFRLNNGRFESKTATDSSASTVIQYFGNEATGELNNDEFADKAFLFSKSDGGSGTFYYVVVALGRTGGFSGTNALLLGDRIAPQTTEIKDMVLIVNYADRKPDEPMTEKPSVGVSKYFRVTGSRLEAVELK